MENKNTILILFIVICLFFGLIVLRDSTKYPMLKDIQVKQEKILDGLKSMPKPSAFAQAGLPPQVEQRLTNLEMQVSGLRGEIEKLKTMAKQPAPQVRQGPPPEDYTTVYPLPIDHSYIKGNKNAPVTITEFTDMQCPFCSRFQTPLEEVLKAYPDKVKIVLKNFPLSFHKNARPAAKAALAAGEQGKYWEMVDLLMQNQKDLGDEKYKELAKQLGLDVDKLEKDLKEKDALFEKQIAADIALGRKVNVRGTPTFFINGKKTRARDLNSYKREIDAILKGK